MGVYVLHDYISNSDNSDRLLRTYLHAYTCPAKKEKQKHVCSPYTYICMHKSIEVIYYKIRRRKSMYIQIYI